MKHIYVPAMEAAHHQQLHTVIGEEEYQFHNILDVPTLVESPKIDFHHLLSHVRQIIDATGYPPDAIIAQWDFPTSLLVPILCHEYGLKSPTIDSILKCEHKLWSRLEQIKVIPEVVPRFSAFDPFQADCFYDIDLPLPFWIKPIKAFSSQLGFLIHDRQEFEDALVIIRRKAGRLAEAFGEVLENHSTSQDRPQMPAWTFLAEEVISGAQIAPEGSVHNGVMQIHSFFDMPLGNEGTSIEGLIYPAEIHHRFADQLTEICQRFLSHIEFDNGCFNAEFMWDRANGRLRLIEFNPRVSQSHSDMCVKVDGVSNHQVAVDIALGRAPWLPCRQGEYGSAAKYLLFHNSDGIIRRVPQPEDIRALQRRYPGTTIEILVAPGTRLSELPNQDSYSYALAILHLGGIDRAQLDRHYQECRRALQFDIEPVIDITACRGSFAITEPLPL